MKSVLKKGLILQRLGKKLVVYDNETSILHEFNETGFFILSELEKEKGMNEIAAKITRKFEVSMKEAKMDTSDFLNILKKKSLLAKKKGG